MSCVINLQVSLPAECPWLMPGLSIPMSPVEHLVHPTGPSVHILIYSRLTMFSHINLQTCRVLVSHHLMWIQKYRSVKQTLEVQRYAKYFSLQVLLLKMRSLPHCVVYVSGGCRFLNGPTLGHSHTKSINCQLSDLCQVKMCQNKYVTLLYTHPSHQLVKELDGDVCG